MNQEDGPEVDGHMHGEQPGLGRPVPGLRAGQRTGAGDVQGNPLQQQQREEQVGLIAEDQPGQAPARLRLGRSEGERPDPDVRVRAFLIRVRVMAVVLLHPPPVAQADAQVAEQDAEHITGAGGAEDLPVPRVVAEEADLGEHAGQEDRHQKLPPGIPQQAERRPAGRQARHRGRDLPGVVSRPPVQQPSFPDQAA
jgi:hypothetical protein